MAQLPGKKNAYQLRVRATWNTESSCRCIDCLLALEQFCEHVGMDIPTELDREFYVPAAWFHANEKIGCPHGKEKLLRSAYVKNRRSPSIEASEKNGIREKTRETDLST